MQRVDTPSANDANRSGQSASSALPATTAFTSQPLAPSELVLLRAPDFAGPANKNDSYEVLGTRDKVSLDRLSRMVIIAAILAAEQAGEVRLETGQKKVMFGLSQANTLYVVPTGTTVSWQAESYESKLIPTATKLAGKKKNNVRDVAFELVGSYDANPKAQTLNNLYAGLNARNLVNKVQKTTLKIIKTWYYEMPASTLELAANTDASCISQLMRDCAEKRPAVWQLLTDEVGKGIASRYRSDDDGPDLDSGPSFD